MVLSNSLKDIRKAIAEEVVNFLKGRMIFNQRFVVDKKEDKIDFKSFISQYRKYNESIEFLRENQDKIMLPENKEMPIKAALSKVNLDAEFPLGIRMNISSDEVSIQHNNMKEVLYKAPSDDKRNIKK